jgi:3-phenylpropionate/trans-cinnamate dioxygenase ferredoxin component
LSDFVDVANVHALAPGRTLQCTVGDTPVVVVNTGDGVFALHGVCTHARGQFGSGRLTRGGEIECPSHGACFDPRSGEVRKGPAREPLRTYEARIEGDSIQVRLTPG